MTFSIPVEMVRKLEIEEGDVVVMDELTTGMRLRIVKYDALVEMAE